MMKVLAMCGVRTKKLELLENGHAIRNTYFPTTLFFSTRTVTTTILGIWLTKTLTYRASDVRKY